MDIFKLAYDAKSGKKGKRVYFDKEETCGAVLRAIGGPEYNGTRSVHAAKYELQLNAARKEKNTLKVEEINKKVNCLALADYVIVELFGWDAPSGVDGELIPLGVITDKKKIFDIISKDHFEPLYTWIITSSSSSDNFRLSPEAACKLAGKLLPSGAGGGKKIQEPLAERLKE